eukprot:314610_1
MIALSGQNSISSIHGSIDPNYADLQEKYDALYDKFRTVELEKQVYEKEIRKLTQEISKLKEQNMLRKTESAESAEFQKVTSPLLTKSITNLSSALEDADKYKETVTDELNEYRHTIKALKVQTAQLKERNTSYEQRLAMVHTYQTKQNMEHAQNMEAMQQCIDDMKTEKGDLMVQMTERSEQYDTLKTELETQLKTQMEVVAPPAQSDIAMDKSHLHLTFQQSTLNANHNKYLHQLMDLKSYNNSSVNRTGGVHFIDHEYDAMPPMTMQLSDEDTSYMSPQEEDVKCNGDDKENGVRKIKPKHIQMDELHVQIETLKRENAKLKRLVQNHAFLTFKWFM